MFISIKPLARLNYLQAILCSTFSEQNDTMGGISEQHDMLCCISQITHNVLIQVINLEQGANVGLYT